MKRIWRAAVQLLLLVTLVGCVPPALPPVPGSTAAADQSWSKVQAKGRLVVGTSADYPPFAYYKDRKLTGFDVAVAEQVARTLGVQVEVKDYAFNGLAGALQRGRIDLAIAAITYAPERAAELELSQPYYQGRGAVLVAAASDFTSFASVRDLAGLKVGVQRDSLYEAWARTYLVDTGLIRRRDLLSYTDAISAANDLQRRRSDVVLLDALSARDLAGKNPLRVVSESLQDAPYVIAAAPGSAQLMAKVDQAIAAMQAQQQDVALAKQFGLLPSSNTPPMPLPTATPGLRPSPVACVNDMKWVQDLTLDDQNMSVPPTVTAGQPVRKGWRVLNSGTCAWDPGYALVFVSGNSLGGQPAPVRSTIPAGQQYDFYVDLTAPTVSGIYKGHWTMRSSSGQQFGERIYVAISVPDMKPTPAPTQTPTTGIAFSVDRTEIRAGESVVFKWDVSAAKEVYFYRDGQAWQDNGVTGKESRTEYPAVSVNYYLRVVKPDGSVETRTLPLSVIPAPTAPTITWFRITPEGQALTGTCISMDWDVRGDVNRITLSRNNSQLWDRAPVTGSANDCPGGPGLYQYLLTAAGPGGTARSQQSVTLIVPMPVATPTAAPTAPATSSPVDTLVGMSWTLSALLGEQEKLTKPITDTLILLRFDLDGTVSGDAGCNTFKGGYDLKGDSLQFRALASTRKACEPHVMKQEDVFLRLLAQVRRVSFLGLPLNQLSMYDVRNREILSFTGHVR